MILLLQPRANFHTSTVPTCLHLLLFATPATLRGSWKRRKISLLHELLPESRLHSESIYLWLKKPKKNVTNFKCPKKVKSSKHGQSSAWRISSEEKNHWIDPNFSQVARCEANLGWGSMLPSVMSGSDEIMSQGSDVFALLLWESKKAKVIPKRDSKELCWKNMSLISYALDNTMLYLQVKPRSSQVSDF